MTAAKTTARPYWLVRDEHLAAERAARQAEDALEWAEIRKARAEAAAAKWTAAGIDPASVLDAAEDGRREGDLPGTSRRGGHRDYDLHRGPTVEEVRALEGDAGNTRARADALAEELRGLAPFDPVKAAVDAGARYIAVAAFTLGGHAFTPGQPVTDDYLAPLPLAKREPFVRNSLKRVVE